MDVHVYHPAATDTFPPTPTSYLEEHYTTHIFNNVDNTPGNDILISAHPNGIAFITLAPSHAAFNTTTSSITNPPGINHLEASLRFDVGYQSVQDKKSSCKSLLDVKFNKGRGPLISPDQPLCKLQFTPKQAETADISSATHTEAPELGSNSTTSTTEYLISCPLVKGLLVEINKKMNNLKGNALLEVLKDEYIAIIELKPSEMEKLREGEAAEAAGMDTTV